MTRSELLPQIFSLSNDDQLKIVESIRINLAGGFSAVDKEIFDAELQRRIDDARQNPDDESPLHEVMARLRKRP